MWYPSVTEAFLWLPGFSNMVETGLESTSVIIPQDPGMYFIGSYGLLYAQVPQVICKLIYYNGGDLIPPISAWRFGDSTDVGRDITSENWGAKKFLVPRSSTWHFSLVFLSYLLWEVHLPFLSNTSVKALLVSLHIPCQIQLQLCLSFSDPIPTHLGSIFVFFLGHMSLVALSQRMATTEKQKILV